LDVLREQSNAGERVCYSSIWEGLLGRSWHRQLESELRLATEVKRVNDSTLDITLRRGVKFHNGDEMTAEDVAFSFGPDRMFGSTQPKAGTSLPLAQPSQSGKQSPADIFAQARLLWPNLVKVEILDKYRLRFTNAVPDVTLEGRIASYGCEIAN